MSTSSVRIETQAARWGGDDRSESDGIPARIFLQPIAPPSVLGLFGFAAATFIVAANLAGWYGNHTTSPLYLAPFAAVFGGVAQFLAGMWAYRARDALATAMHGMWGSFWIAFGILSVLLATGALAPATPWYDSPELGYWFFALAIITGSGAAAALTEGLGLFAVLATLAAGSGIAAGGYILASETTLTVAGWVFVFSAGFAWYVATASMLAHTAGRVVLPLGRYERETNRPGGHPTRVIQLAHGEPGVKHGQ